MARNIDLEFLRALGEVTQIALTPEMRQELAAYFPEQYGGGQRIPDDLLFQAGLDYLKIIKSYLLYHKIPILMDTLCCAYMWGVPNLVTHGLFNAPPNVKRCIGFLKRQLQPDAEQLENIARYYGNY